MRFGSRTAVLAPSLSLAVAAGALALGAAVVLAPAHSKAAAESVPCGQMDQALAGASAEGRSEAARAALTQECRPMPATLWSALEKGTWSDGANLAGGERVALLALAMDHGYPEAESLAVSVLQSGTWPGGLALTVEAGGQLVRGLRPVLTPYRVRLLLDIYEQVDDSYVRTAVIETLRGAPWDMALLPALEAYYEGTGMVQQAGLATVSEKTEADPPRLLARLVRTLPEGPLLAWARRLADRHPSDAVEAALKSRASGEAGGEGSVPKDAAPGR